MTAADDPLAVARRALEPGERLVWADRPDPRALARSRLPQFIRGLLGIAVIAAFLWLAFIPHWPDGLRGLLLGVFLVAATLYSLWLLAAPLVALQAAEQTVYAVTDCRLLVLEDWPFRRRQSYRPADFDDIVMTPPGAALAGGRGSVIFIHRKLPWWQRSAGGSYRIEALYGIPEARQVGERIEALRRAAQAPPTGAAG